MECIPGLNTESVNNICVDLTKMRGFQLSLFVFDIVSSVVHFHFLRVAFVFLFIVGGLCDRESRRRKEELQQAVEKSSNNACTVYKGNRCPYIF